WEWCLAILDARANVREEREFMAEIIITTTPTIEGRTIEAYLGVVAGEAIVGANVFRDLMASLRDIVGGRSAAYERELERARSIALQEMEEKCRELGGNAVVGVDLDYEVVGATGSMLMVSASGTAVRIRWWPPLFLRLPVNGRPPSPGLRPRFRGDLINIPLPFHPPQKRTARNLAETPEEKAGESSNA